MGGSWVTNPYLIKDEVFDFFSSKFAEDSFSRPALVSNFFKKLFDAQSSSLESPFSLEEIKIAVWECGNDKSLGLDGFTFNFIKKFWDLHSPDINKFVMHFHETGTIHKGCNSSFISLLPKCSIGKTRGLLSFSRGIGWDGSDLDAAFEYPDEFHSPSFLIIYWGGNDAKWGSPAVIHGLFSGWYSGLADRKVTLRVSMAWAKGPVW
ncbi:hypothetical protein Tco_0933125 [Tanacetum coccineum]